MYKKKIFYLTLGIIILLVLATFFFLTKNNLKQTSIESIQKIDQRVENQENISVYFYSETCDPCILEEEILEKYNIQYPNYNYIKVNVDDKTSDETEKLFKKYNIQYTPTFLKFNKGNITERYEGYANIKQLEKIKFGN